MTPLRALVLSLVALAASTTAALAGDASCVPDELGTLTPATVPAHERAIEQDLACKVILELQASIGSCTNAAAAIAFCKAPLTAPLVSGETLLQVRRDAEATPACARSATSVTTQTAPILSLGTSFQDDLLRGVAAFVVSRAKAEAMAFLIERLDTLICGDADARALVPNSCDLLESLDPTEGDPMAWGTLKAAFEIDLEQLPERAVACVATKAGVAADTRALLVTLVQVATLVRAGEDPLAVLAGLTDRFADADCTADSVSCGLYLVGFAVRTITPSANVNDPNAPPPAPAHAQRFREIAGRRLLEAAVAKKLTKAPTAADLAKHAETLYGFVLRLDEKVRRAGGAAEQVGPDADRFQSIVRLSTNVIDLVIAAAALVPDDRFPTIGGASGKPRALAILRATKLVAAAVDAAVERDFGRTFVHVRAAVSALQKQGSAGGLPGPFAKYGAFLAEVAAAKTPEDVQRAIETAAAPIGGGKAKRGTGKRTIAINAFFGLQGGVEVNARPDEDTAYGVHGGLFAPVGIDASWGACKSLSYGVFLSVIDLGALTSLRTSVGDDAMDDDVEGTPEVGFRQVLSPGLYGVLGYDRFAFGVGASMTPSLRRITDDGVLVEEAPALRVGAFAAVDVTIFPF